MNYKYVDTLEDYENASSSSDEEQESEPEKLTRAQRKKIRKKKLKEQAIRRGKLIGPLLPLNPTNTNQCANPDAKHSPPVRSNASENEEISGADEPGLNPFSTSLIVFLIFEIKWLRCVLTLLVT